MQQDPEILALQRRVEAFERILRSGVAVNPGGGGDESVITIIADNDPNIHDPPTQITFPGKKNDMYMIYNHLD